MTDMYDKPKDFEGKLKPYPHEERGVEVRLDRSVDRREWRVSSVHMLTFIGLSLFPFIYIFISLLLLERPRQRPGCVSARR